MSGIDLPDGTEIRKGAGSAVRAWLTESHIDMDIDTLAHMDRRVDAVSESGGTPLVVAVRTPDHVGKVLGVVHLKDIVKEGLTDRFSELRRMGIRTVMVTGEADVGVAMNNGTSAAKEAGNMVDLDSDPTKLISIVGIGKQLLITRGALTTFSIANDIAKYFAIIPAIFMATYPGLSALNIMGLHSPASAVLSAIIFNAIIIVILVPLALKGVSYKPAGASKILARNLRIYGLGGVVAPFIGIWLIDLLVRLIPGF